MTIPAGFDSFRAAAQAEGYAEAVARTWEPGTVVDTHVHPFEAKAVVVEGEMWLTVAGRTRHLKAGDRFHLAPGVPHEERYGPQGATYWVARR